MKLAIPHPMHLEERGPAIQPKTPKQAASFSVFRLIIRAGEYVKDERLKQYSR